MAAVAMARVRGRGIHCATLLGFSWTIALVLALLIPDYRVLMVVAYAPIVVIGEPFGWPPGVSLLDAFPWPVVNQFVCVGGGLLWAATALAYGRRSAGACGFCGRKDASSGWTTPESAARWGRWAVGVAVVIPVFYALTRWAWALGIPLGISEELLREGQEIGLWWAGAGIATIAVGGAALTLGLVHRWGEVFPHWIPFLSGRRVPIPLAVVPASLVSVRREPCWSAPNYRKEPPMTESNSSPESMLAAFDRHCPLLFSIAYRMLGSVADAEDVVQEAYLRWQRASDVRSPKAYLSTVVPRLCLDHLRTAPPGFVVRRMRINGRLGLVGYFEDGSPHSVTTLDLAEDEVRAIRLVVNPEKLGGVPPLDRAEIVEGPR